MVQLESMYQDIILDHYRNPHHKGLRDPFDAEVHHVNPVCGDEVTLRVTLKDVNGEPVIEDQAREALDGLVADFRINWVWMPPWGPENITDDGREQLRALGFNI